MSCKLLSQIFRNRTDDNGTSEKHGKYHQRYGQE